MLVAVLIFDTKYISVTNRRTEIPMQMSCTLMYHAMINVIEISNSEISLSPVTQHPIEMPYLRA